MSSNKIDRISIFCGANSGNSSLYVQQAKELADILCQHDITLVYGGAKVGLMGVLATHMLEQGAKVIGVIPQSLVDVEIVHEGLTELHIVDSMHERKVLMSELAHGFMMLPGGFGSLDEFFEMATLSQLGYHQKPCGILNTAGYYDYLLKFLDHALTEGFLKRVHRTMIIVESSPSNLINEFLHYQPTSDKRWIKDDLFNSEELITT